MWKGAVTERMLRKPIYEELKKVAQLQETTTYGAIAPLAGLDMENPADSDAIRQILGIISTYEHHQGRPMLTAIVAHKQDNIPGHGFFELARLLGVLKSGADELAFFCGEVSRVHNKWRPTKKKNNWSMATEGGTSSTKRGAGSRTHTAAARASICRT